MRSFLFSSDGVNMKSRLFLFLRERVTMSANIKMKDPEKS